MSVMDKFLNIMKLNDGEDDGYYEDDDYLDDEDPKESKISPIKNDNVYEEEKVKKSVARVSPIRQQQPRRVSGSGMEVCVIKPTSMEEAREITETLLANRTVVLNLEGIDVDVAQRVIDFTSGSCYAISGNLQKISHYIFIITPASVDISGDFQEILSGSFDVPSIHNT
ncbi:MAG: cell division protein SepF [Lachnospiraceae bacterium]|nr:cell division protein SepF [Lachnospiraceae bacterium]